MGKESAFKFVPERTSDNPISYQLSKKKQINEEITAIERLVRIEACTSLYTSLKSRIDQSSLEYTTNRLLPVTIIQREPDDESLMPMLLPELCKKFHPQLNVVILIDGTFGLIKRFKAQADREYPNIVFLSGAHLPYPQEVSDFMSFLLEQPFSCHLVLDDATPLIYSPILLREHLVLQKIDYPQVDSLLSIFLQQIFKLDPSYLKYLPGVELIRYLLSSGEEYYIPFTFFQITQHIKYSAMYNFSDQKSYGKQEIGLLAETLLMTLLNLNQRNSFASLYSFLLTRREFISSSFFRSITSQLYVLKRDVLISIANRLLINPQNGQIEVAITRKWEEMVLGIPPEEAFLGGVTNLKKAFTPNFHLSLWSALKTPQMYLPGVELVSSLSKDYPDICIAYRTLLSFPRLVNVHDWAGAFASVLGFTEISACAGRFIYSLRCLLLVGVIRNKTKRPIPDFVERCNLGDACQF